MITPTSSLSSTVSASAAPVTSAKTAAENSAFAGQLSSAIDQAPEAAATAEATSPAPSLVFVPFFGGLIPGTTLTPEGGPSSMTRTIVPYFDSLVSDSPQPYIPLPSQEAAPKKMITATQAYWAAQPPEIQALRDAPDQETRTAQAMDLAKQGFSIDVPIMVWGWNPLVTMQIRQNDGYTWVPSGLQPPIPVAPGIPFPGFQSYDANKPPTGSIMVTTDFAKGTLDDPALS
jgi:hypothetical protein